jgi:hypothetical protein
MIFPLFNTAGGGIGICGANKNPLTSVIFTHVGLMSMPDKNKL